MPKREITQFLQVPELASGFYRVDSTYTNWRPNGSGDYLMIYTVEGSGLFVTPTGSCVTRQGDAVLYVPNQMQDYSTCPKVGRWTLSWVHFVPKPHFLTWLNWPKNDQELRLIHLEKGELRKRYSSAMREIISLSRRSGSQAISLASNELEAALLWANVAFSNQGWYSIDARVRKAVDYLTTNVREPFQMAKLARHAGISESRLAHLFKCDSGTSPQKFLERHRIQEACNLLRITDRSVSEIAGDVGYEDPFYFSNRFHLHVGKSPSGFRNAL